MGALLWYPRFARGAWVIVKAREREEAVVEVEADSDLAKALADAGRNPATIVSNGRRSEAAREPCDPIRDDDPEAFEAALSAVVGTVTPEEGEQWIQDISRWREERSKPPIVRDIPD